MQMQCLPACLPACLAILLYALLSQTAHALPIACAICAPPAGAATGDAVATFDQVGVLVPRGRFDIEMYMSALKLVGQVS